MTGLYVIVGVGAGLILGALVLVWKGAWRSRKPWKGEGA